MTVKALMSSNIITIGMDNQLGKVKKIFEEMKFHHLLVVENRQLMGVVSDRDSGIHQPIC